MVESFSFCGVDVTDLGLEYVPDLENTYVYKPAEAEMHEETFEGHHGGYFYGATRKPKEFILRCCFEERIDKGLLAQFHSLFKVGRKGKLIFTKRPWCYYYATVTEIDDTELLSYRSGILKVSMKAGYPFGLCDDFVNIRTDPFHDEIALNTGLFENPDMILPTSFTSITKQTSFLLANPGTERASVGIKIQGNVGTGVNVTNSTTGQTCRFIGFDDDITTNSGKWVYVDGITGKVLLTNMASDTKLAFLYHDAGFIELDPGFPVLRDIYASSSGTTVTTTNIIHEDLSGKYIFLDSSWCKITKSVDKHTFTTNKTANCTAVRTTVMPLNEIVIKPDTFMNINIEFIYKPTFA